MSLVIIVYLCPRDGDRSHGAVTVLGLVLSTYRLVDDVDCMTPQIVPPLKFN